MTWNPSNLKLLYTEEEIERTIDRLAVQLNLDLHGEDPVFVCILKGALPLTWDLMRRMNFDVSLSYVRVRRFMGTTGGTPQLYGFEPTEFENKVVVLVDTVLDEGDTMNLLLKTIEPIAKKLLTVVLVQKQTQYQGSADYVGFQAPDRFLCGRGMDFDGKYRGLPAIYMLEE